MEEKEDKVEKAIEIMAENFSNFVKKKYTCRFKKLRKSQI